MSSSASSASPTRPPSSTTSSPARPQKRWSPVVLLETVAQAELEARTRRRVERRLQDARLGRFRPMADWDWDWPKQIHRPTVERVLTLDFVTQRENAILVAAHFANASCAVALIDRLTHHAEIVSIERESYRKREAERSHKSRR